MITEREYMILSGSLTTGVFSLRIIASYWSLLLERPVSTDEARVALDRINASRQARAVGPVRGRAE